MKHYAIIERKGNYIAKGDQKRYQSALDTNSALTQNVATQAIKNSNAMTPQFMQNYSTAANQQMGDYSNIMGKYNSFQSDPALHAGYTDLMHAPQSSRAGYENFASTGGFSPLDMQAMRARSSSAAKATYGNATDEMRRAGINNPAAYARIARQKAGDIGELTAGAEGNIAQMRQSGKQFGVQGMEHLDATDAALKQAGLAGLSDLDKTELAKLSSMSSLYSASPGLAGTFGNQVLGATGQGLQGAGLQNDVSNSYLQNLLNKQKIPSNWSQALGKIGQIASIGGAIPGMFTGFGGGGGGSKASYNPSTDWYGT